MGFIVSIQPVNKRKWFSLNYISCQLYVSLIPTAITSLISSALVYLSGSCVGFLLTLGCEFCGAIRLSVCTATQHRIQSRTFSSSGSTPSLEEGHYDLHTFNIFTSSFSSLNTSAWVVVRSPAPSLSCHHQCPHTGTAAPQSPSRLQRSQNESLQTSVGWDFHEGRAVMQVRRILTAEEDACGNCGACLD